MSQNKEKIVYKSTSFYERSHNPELCKVDNFDYLNRVHKPIKILRRVSYLDETTKRNVVRTEYKEVNRLEEMKPYRCSDFSLENLISVGASLTPAVMTSSRSEAIANAEVAFSNIASKMNKTE